MRIISVCTDASRNSESEGSCSTDQDYLTSRDTTLENLNVFDNSQGKKCEKHLTVIINPNRFQRRGLRNIDRNDRSINGSTPGNTVRSVTGNTVRSWQSCDDNKSIPDTSRSCASSITSRSSKRKRLQRKLVRGLCLAGWIVCCPCWAVGFILREPPETEADLAADPCWPCSSWSVASSPTYGKELGCQDY